VRDCPGHDRRHALDYRKAEREFGYKPARDLAQSLRLALEWHSGNTAGWQALLERDYSAWIDMNYKRS
jgi:dTDP-glucose 4,6-dehydratase